MTEPNEPVPWLSDAEIRERLEPIVRVKTLDEGVENQILEVGTSFVVVQSDEPLKEGQPEPRPITFDQLRDWDKKPNRSIRRTLARILGLSPTKG